MPVSVHFDADTATLHSVVDGVLSAEDVDAWSAGLHATTNGLADGAAFCFLSDFHGYNVADQDRAVHMRVRSVAPRFLAAHGFVVGFWRLDGIAPPPPSRRGVCMRVAHVHHDCRKMRHYDELLGSSVERFFCEREQARAWLSAGIG